MEAKKGDSDGWRQRKARNSSACLMLVIISFFLLFALTFSYRNFFCKDPNNMRAGAIIRPQNKALSCSNFYYSSQVKFSQFLTFDFFMFIIFCRVIWRTWDHAELTGINLEILVWKVRDCFASWYRKSSKSYRAHKLKWGISLSWIPHSVGKYGRVAFERKTFFRFHLHKSLQKFS